MSATRYTLLLAALLLALGTYNPVQAQTQPRYGIGLQMMGTTVDDNIGPGLRFRSLGIGAGLTGYIFQGQDDAAYAFDPQASLVVTLPGPGTQRLYVLGGGGAYVPFGNLDSNVSGGPTLHFGIGKVWLLNESSFFLEFDPALFIGEEETDVILPLRVGVIF
ncbi:MAG: hypothetical protein BRD25_00600 [Bacteroidetes bacterium QH_1_61_8]|nr:MAG: hypothetical protein BRD25_00600 [Bacteroidetes bacterium QH_1_61_8]